mgnify:CR=1 FL=1
MSEYVRTRALVTRRTSAALKREARRRKISVSVLAGILLDTAVEGADWGGRRG